MTNDNHSITPPPELLQKWATEYWGNPGESISQGERYIAIEAARWGYEQRGADIEDKLQKARDEELDACCEWLKAKGWILPEFSVELRAARRLKPPSLKEQALEAAQRFYANGHHDCSDDEIKGDFDIIRRALESLSS